ncbi:MAG: DUF1995 family protein [Drouetiella hepatica Uher 2000/2452]|jgi:hypothetical protein|uniref:DUF1995 family protein n=1 Tax=Drouetiella hepatica Uher 2000/2452 TaxID=904376 RepID=A0A951QFJ1_9CYAN|nr:DUF1995 family protein [Drouetiella hepatica Uher 2000/2452]
MALPNTLEEAIAQAQQATTAAIADGYRRIQVDLLFPELKIMPVAEQFLPTFEHLGAQFRVYFPDAGSAALARRDWGEKPYAIRGINDMKAEMQPDEQAFLFVQPSSVEVLEVEKLCQEAMDRPVVMLNPNLEDVAIIGIGYAGRQLRDRFLSTFESCYYLRPIEGAAVFRAYPGLWQVWQEKEGTYELIAEETQRPAGEALDRILMGAGNPTEAQPPRRGLLSSLQQFLRALSQ